MGRKVKRKTATGGMIRAGAKPMRRGVWDLYELTNNDIGGFEKSFWLEHTDEFYFPHDQHEAALDELAVFFRDNIVDNIVFMEFTHTIIMGGVTDLQSTAGKCVHRDYFQRKRWKKEGVVEKFPRTPLISGYELRLSKRDAITFLTLWRGYNLVKD